MTPLHRGILTALALSTIFWGPLLATLYLHYR